MASKGNVVNELSTFKCTVACTFGFLGRPGSAVEMSQFAFTRTQTNYFNFNWLQIDGCKYWICENNKPDMLIYSII